MAAPVRVGGGSVLVLHVGNAGGEGACTSLVSDGDAPPLRVRFTPYVPPGAGAQEAAETVEAVLEPGGSLKFATEERDGAWSARVSAEGDSPECPEELP